MYIYILIYFDFTHYGKHIFTNFYLFGYILHDLFDYQNFIILIMYYIRLNLLFDLWLNVYIHILFLHLIIKMYL